MKIRNLLLCGFIFMLLFGLTGCGSTENEADEKKSDDENGFVISYEDEEYVTKNDDGKIVFKNGRNIPIVVNKGNQDVADKIQKSLVEISDKNWKYLKETADEYTPDTPAYEVPYGVDYMISTEVEKDNYITFRIDQTGSMGGVTWTAIEYYSYDTKTGDLLTLSNVAIDEDELKEFLHGKMEEYVKKNYEDVLSSDLDKAIDQILAEQGNWGLLEDKFIVILPKYSIESGAAGVQSVEINGSEVNEFLVEKYQI